MAIKASAQIDLIDLTDGKDAIVLHVSSSNGTSFKNSDISTTFTVSIIVGDKRIENSNDMYNIIFDINKSFKITIIMISHDINSACKYANKILHINKNQVFFGSSNDYLKSDAVKTFYHNKND